MVMLSPHLLRGEGIFLLTRQLKNRHSGRTPDLIRGGAGIHNTLYFLDSRLRGNDMREKHCLYI